MGLRQGLLSLIVFAGLARPLAATDLVTETWRSMWGVSYAVAANASDGSVWATVGSGLYHLSADGDVLLRKDDFWGPLAVAVNTTDGSCWVVDSRRNQVVHVSAAGEELWRGGFVGPLYLSVNSADGSVWVGQTGQNPATPEVAGVPELLRLAADGTVLWRSDAYWPADLAVSPADGACWLYDYNLPRLVRLSPSGEETVSVAGLAPDTQIGVGLADGSVWVSDPDQEQVVHLSASGEEIEHIDMVGPGDVAVDPTDGSLWVFAPTPPSSTTPYGAHDVVHLAADGAELWRQGGFGDPWVGLLTLAANPADGSVWVTDIPHASLVHLDADGVESFRGRGFDDPVAVAASSADQTVWVADSGRSQMVQLDAGGRQVSTINDCWPVALAVSPTDGSVWEMDGAIGGVVHYSREGAELWRQSGPGPFYAVAINPDDGSGWVAFLDTIVHYSPSGDELWRGTGFWGSSRSP